MGLGQRPGPGIGQIHYSTAVISSLDIFFLGKIMVMVNAASSKRTSDAHFQQVDMILKVLMKCLQHTLVKIPQSSNNTFYFVSSVHSDPFRGMSL